MAKLDPPPKFTFKPTEWLEWIEEFGRFRTATKLHKEDGDVQRDSLLYAMGDGKPIEFSERCCSRRPTQTLITIHSWRCLLSISYQN